MANIMEAKAIISAEDRTGAVFDKVTRRARELTRALQDVGKATKGMRMIDEGAARQEKTLERIAAGYRAVAVARTAASSPGLGGGAARDGWAAGELSHLREIQRVQRQIIADRRRMASLPSHATGGGVGGTPPRVSGGRPGRPGGAPGSPARTTTAPHGPTIAGAIAGGTATALSGKALHYAVSQGADAAAEDVKESFQGFTPEQIEHTNRKALDLSAKFPSVSALSIRKYQRTGTALTADYHHAEDLLEQMVRSRVMLGIGGNTEGADHDVETIVRAGEVLNKAQSAQILGPILNSFVKAKALYGETVQSDQFRDYAVRAKTSAVGLDDSFLSGIVPSLIQEVGGSTLGQSQATALGNVSRPRVRKDEILALRRGGLLDRHNRMINGDLARRNPYTYANTVIAESLKRQGVDVDAAQAGDQTARLAAQDKLAQMFPDRNAGFFWEKMILDRNKLSKNQAQYKHTAGTEGAEEASRRDPYTGASGVTTQIGNTIQALTSGPMKDAAPVLDATAKGIGKLNAALAKHPSAAKQAGIVGGAGVAAGGLSILGTLANLTAGEGMGPTSNLLRLLGAGAQGAGGFLAKRLIPGYLGWQVGSTLGRGASGLHDIAAGKYWNPADVEDVTSLRAEARELQAQIDNNRERSKSPETLEMINSPLQSRVAELRNRIRAGDEQFSSRWYDAEGGYGERGRIGDQGIRPSPGIPIPPARADAGPSIPGALPAAPVQAVLSGSADVKGEVAVRVEVFPSSLLESIVKAAQSAVVAGTLRPDTSGTSMPQYAKPALPSPVAGGT